MKKSNAAWNVTINRREYIDMHIHIFAPSFPSREWQGVFRFDQISFDDASKIIANGKWIHPETNQEFALFSGCDIATLTPIIWRHSWPGVRRFLNSNGFSIKAEIERRGFGAGGYQHRMEVGDVGIVFRNVNRADLKSPDLTLADFEFTEVERIE